MPPKLIVLPVIIFLGFGSASANADIFKCKGLDGKVYYTNVSCPKEAEKDEVIPTPPAAPRTEEQEKEIQLIKKRNFLESKLTILRRTEGWLILPSGEEVPRSTRGKIIVRELDNVNQELRMMMQKKFREQQQEQSRAEIKLEVERLQEEFLRDNIIPIDERDYYLYQSK